MTDYRNRESYGAPGKSLLPIGFEVATIDSLRELACEYIDYSHSGLPVSKDIPRIRSHAEEMWGIGDLLEAWATLEPDFRPLIWSTSFGDIHPRMLDINVE